jgi:HK97 family phage prohead protease
METIKRAIGTINYRSEGEAMPKEFGGIAAVVDTVTDLRFFEEKIERGAFDQVLEDDVRVLFNHEAEAILGRTKSNTARIWVNADGNLEYSWVPDYENPLHMQVARSIMRGDITQSSFAFTVKEYSWGKSERYGDMSMHIVRKIDKLLDVSPVTYPAYEDTVAEARSILATKPKKVNESDLIEITKLKYK